MIKKLNSICRARLNFRRWPILCTTLYRNPVQASNFGGTFDQLSFCIFLCNFHRRCLSTSAILWCKKAKNDEKLKSRPYKGVTLSDFRGLHFRWVVGIQVHGSVYTWSTFTLLLTSVWEIPRSRYTHVKGRRRMSAVVLHAVSRDFDLVIHLAQCGLDNQSAGAARHIFFLLRHLSKFPSCKKENPSCRFWDMALGSFAAAFEKRSLRPDTRVRWRGMVRCGALATKARKSMVVETSFADALVRECTNRVWRNSLRAPGCCLVVAWLYQDLGISRTAHFHKKKDINWRNANPRSQIPPSTTS